MWVTRGVFCAALLLLSVGGMADAEEGDASQPEWPYYVPRNVQPPDVDGDKAWVRNEIDAFILQRLKQDGLKPAREATPRALVRRLYLDLLGLPPSPEELSRYLADDSSDAYESLVDRLLEDPRYGERWARRWLDLARYADTAGYEGDPDLPHTWRYRDYVIDSFNTDKPYNLFIKEQLAGDEFDDIMGAGDLPAVPPERLVALTFLRLAPFTEPRGDETRHELLSEMTSTVSSVFLGLTVGCAKCHDHKYDDIPTRDFYRLKAFFSTVSIPRPAPGDAFQIGGSLKAAFYRKDEEAWAEQKRNELKRSESEAESELARLKSALTKRLGQAAGFGLQAMGGKLGNDYVFDRTSVNDGNWHTSIVNCDGRQWDFFLDGKGPQKTGSNAGQNRGLWFDDLPVFEHITLGQYSAGTGDVRDSGAHHKGRFAQVLIYDHPLDDDERAAIQRWAEAGSHSRADSSSTQDAAAPPEQGLTFWLDAGDLDADTTTDNPPDGSPVSHWVDRIGGVTLTQEDRQRMPGISRSPVRDGETPDKGRDGVNFDDDFLVAEISKPLFRNHSSGAIVIVYTATHEHEGYGFEVGGKGSFLSTFINPQAAGRENFDAFVDGAENSLLSEEERRRYRWLSTRKEFVSQHLKRLEPTAMSLRHSYGPPYEPGVPTSRVMLRGEHDNPGEIVQAGFPRVLTGHQKPAEIRLDPFKRWPTRSRRMALAEWIASAQNPMTSRVIVNRLWAWHFGRGIVSTPSDFGALSDGPSHRELLDWLAIQLVEQKWSLKSIHRLLVTSATYRQTSLREDARASRIDPDNMRLWKFRRQRLEAEVVRDTILTVSGRLNTEQYGLPIFPPLPDGIEQRVKYTSSKWDTQHGHEGRKRSIYIYQQRTLAMPFLQSFDATVCDESRPRRRHSTTPLQALAMYNGRFVSEESKHFAKRVQDIAGVEVPRQIEIAFQIALSRSPTDAERRTMTALITSSEPAGTGLAAVCRVLLNCNEFIHID